MRRDLLGEAASGSELISISVLVILSVVGIGLCQLVSCALTTTHTDNSDCGEVARSFMSTNFAKYFDRSECKTANISIYT